MGINVRSEALCYDRCRGDHGAVSLIAHGTAWLVYPGDWLTLVAILLRVAYGGLQPLDEVRGDAIRRSLALLVTSCGVAIVSQRVSIA